VNVIFAATPDALATVKRATTSIPVVAVDLERDLLVRFPPAGPFLWKLGAFWRPFSFRARYDRGVTQSCLEQIMSKGTVKWFNQIGWRDPKRNQR
jgi:hypothetical protein